MSRQIVENILMQRDGMSRREAEKSVTLCTAEIEDAISCGDFDLVEDIVAGDLGLEMDYIFDLLY